MQMKHKQCATVASKAVLQTPCIATDNMNIQQTRMQVVLALQQALSMMLGTCEQR